MASVISLGILLAATLLAVATAFPSEKLPYNGPRPIKAALPPPSQQSPKGLIPRPQRSAPSSDLKTSESYGYGYYGGFGYPYFGYGYGYPYYGYGFGYPYYGYGYGYGFGYGGYYPFFGGYYGGFYPWDYDFFYF